MDLMGELSAGKVSWGREDTVTGARSSPNPWKLALTAIGMNEEGKRDAHSSPHLASPYAYT